MIAPLSAHRAVPFRVACVVGLDEGAFPARDQPSPLDLRHDSGARPGDVSPRDRDRHAFFEVLLGTRDALHLSYVGVEPKSGQTLGPSSVVLELADALAPYIGAASSREALEAITTRHPLHRFGERATGASEIPPAITRERWAVRVRDALRGHLRHHGHAVPDEDGMLALLRHEAIAPELRAALGIVDALPEPAAVARSRPLSLANLRAFLEWPVQAWAQAVLGLDELPDEAVVDHSDEPFEIDPPIRAVLLRDALVAQLHDPRSDAGTRYDAIVGDLELRGQFPVGVFGEVARDRDLRTLEQWRAELGPIAVGSATRFAFGRSTAKVAVLRPAIDLELAPGRSVRLVGQTELVLAAGGSYTSVIPIVGTASLDSRYHLRGAFDALVLAAAGISSTAHAHVLLDKDGTVRRVSHDPWSQADARAFLAELARELLDQPHGYLLPLKALSRALSGKPASSSWRETDILGYGPIERMDGLAEPADAAAIAKRRLAPIVARMHGEHSLGAKS
jgi:exodeoxyribonuclease V gamma subunit